MALNLVSSPLVWPLSAPPASAATGGSSWDSTNTMSRPPSPSCWCSFRDTSSILLSVFRWALMRSTRSSGSSLTGRFASRISSRAPTWSPTRLSGSRSCSSSRITKVSNPWRSTRLTHLHLILGHLLESKTIVARWMVSPTSQLPWKKKTIRFNEQWWLGQEKMFMKWKTCFLILELINCDITTFR